MAASESVKLVTTGMHCPSCSMLIQMSLEDLDGVSEARADFRTGVTEVVYDPDVVTVDRIVTEIRSAGYDTTGAE
ncbi:MAG: heavy-metal-associated domain-containing protein [Coriobacteriia bacterium]